MTESKPQDIRIDRDPGLPGRYNRPTQPPDGGPQIPLPRQAIQTTNTSLVALLSGLEPHDHLCLIYETRDEWRAAIVPFMAIGLKKGQKCIYVVDTHTADEIRGLLAEEGIDVDSAERSGQFAILSEGQAYSMGGFFDPERMIQLLIEETEKALSQGYPALRVTGEMTWVMRGYPGSDRLLEYEAKLNRDFFSRYKCLAICQYDRWKFDPEIIKGVIMTHPLLVHGTHVYRNVYYVPPEEFLATTYATREAQHLLNNLERERQHVESLRAEEERYRTLFEQSIDAISLVGSDDRFIAVNDAWLELFGYTRDDLSSLTVWDIYVDEADRADFLRRIAASGSVRDEVRFKRKDGTVFDCQRSTTAQKDAHGRLVAYQGVYRDITEQKKAVARLQESEEKFRQLFTQSMDAISIFALATGRLEVNQAWRELFGYEEEEVPQLEPANFYVDPADREVFLRRIRESGYVRDEVRFRKKDGTAFDCARTAVALHDTAGAVRFIQSVHHDITAEKRVAQALRASEEKFRELFEQSQDAIAIVTVDGTILDANSAYLRLLGLAPKDKGHVNVRDHYENPADRDAFVRRMETEGVVNDEQRLLRADGSVIDCLRSSVARRDEHGRIVMFQTVLRDITARKRAETALRESEDRLRSLSAYLEDVREQERTGIARELHDQVGQALTALRIDMVGVAKLLQQGVNVPADMLPQMVRLVDETIDDVRRISSELRPGILDDFGLVAAMDWQLSQYQRRTGISCRLEASDTLNIDRSTSTALYRVFQELLTNVVRHAAARKIDVRFEERDGRYVLTVEDDGRGIEPDQIGSPSSFGLIGMRERLRPLHGTLTLTGSPGKGTIAQVTVPVR